MTHDERWWEADNTQSSNTIVSCVYCVKSSEYTNNMRAHVCVGQRGTGAWLGGVSRDAVILGRAHVM